MWNIIFKLFFYKAAVFSFLIFLTGCPGGGSGSSRLTIPFDKEKDARENMSKNTPRCFSDDCSDVAGSVYTIFEIPDDFGGSDFSVGLCSGTLIAPNRILTNFHCVFHAETKVLATCADIRVAFPKTKNFPSENLACSKIVTHSDSRFGPTVVTPDWAIIELAKPLYRGQVKIKSEGVPDNSQLKLYPVFYDEALNGMDGLIRPVSCQSDMKQFFSAEYNFADSAIINFYCEKRLIPGTSGTGIFSEDGSLIAINSFGLRFPKDTLLISFKFMNEEYDSDKFLSGGTNFSCIFPLDKAPMNYHCQNGFLASETNFVDYLGQLVSRLVEGSTLSDLGMVYSVHLGWDVSLREQDIYEKILSDGEKVGVTWEDSIDEDFTDGSIWSSLYFLDDIFNGFFLEPTFGPQRELERLEVFKKVFPKKIKCLSAASKLNPVSVQIPYFQARRENAKIIGREGFFLPAQSLFFSLDFEFDPGEGQFLGTFKGDRSGVSSSTDLTKIEAIEEDYSSHWVECVLRDKMCSSFKKLMPEALELTVAKNADENLINNLIYQGLRTNQVEDLGAVEVKVPVCN